MRVSIDHRTTYRFTAPQGRVVQLLRMTPRNTHDQTVADWHLTVDCDARTRDHRDGFGNLTTMLYAEGPIEEVAIFVTGEVVTSGSDGAVVGAFEPLPPRLYLRETDTTLADDAIAAFARGTLNEIGDTVQLLRLATALRERFTVDPARPKPGVTAAEAFGRKSATSRDLAQMLIVAARGLDVPARYVTGYCDLQADHRPTPHGWAEMYLGDLGWIGVDPTLGKVAGEHHVRVAIALDAFGAAPVAGSRLGDGDERLDVDVTVQAEE